MLVTVRELLATVLLLLLTADAVLGVAFGFTTFGGFGVLGFAVFGSAIFGFPTFAFTAFGFGVLGSPALARAALGFAACDFASCGSTSSDFASCSFASGCFAISAAPFAGCASSNDISVSYLTFFARAPLTVLGLFCAVFLFLLGGSDTTNTSDASGSMTSSAGRIRASSDIGDGRPGDDMRFCRSKIGDSGARAASSDVGEGRIGEEHIERLWCSSVGDEERTIVSIMAAAWMELHDRPVQSARLMRRR